jgi:hypothetical protein
MKKLLMILCIVTLTGCSVNYKRCSGRIKLKTNKVITFTNAKVKMRRILIHISKGDYFVVKEDCYINKDEVKSIYLEVEDTK